MKKWYLKAVVQKAISFLPFRNRINFFFQKYVTRGVELNEEHFFNKFGHLLDHLEHYQATTGRSDLRGGKCLELGTGWYPIVPIGYYLKGADHVYSVDISAHLTTATLLRCLAEIDRHRERFRVALGTIDEKRWTQLDELRRMARPTDDLAELCARLHFTPIVQDARTLEFPGAGMALISSNNTYEHIYPEVLAGIVERLWRLTAPGGVMSHFIDLSDHFAHMDPTIDIYNFLRYTERQWQLIDNAIQPQNRWRMPQYRALYQRLGVPFREEKIRSGDLALVRATPLAAPFAEMPVEEVAVSHGYLVSER